MISRQVVPLAVLILSVLACNAPTEVAELMEPSPVEPAVISLPTTEPTLTPTVTLTLTPSLLVHEVQNGENLTVIAQRYGVTVDAIVQLNELTNPESIYAGQQLRIPPPDTPLDLFPTATPRPTRQPAQDGADAPPPTPDVVSGGIYDDGPSNVLYEYSIPYLTTRTYDGGTIELGDVRTNDSVAGVYQQYGFWHQSEGVRVTGLVNIPAGNGPFPVAIVMHGGIAQSAYYQGWGTANHASRLAQAGYITFMPDYQTYNETEGTGYPLKIPWALDVMNLIEALPTLPQADPERIGVMGHSRGGGLASYLMVLSPQVDAVVLYAPLHLDQEIVWERYLNVFGAEWPSDGAKRYGTPQQNPAGFRMVSPWYFLEQTSMPVQIHHGTADGTLPVSWSRDLYDRMARLGLPATYYEYEGGGHSFTGQDYTTFITRMISFFDQHVK